MARVVGRASSGQEEHLLVQWKKAISSAQVWMQTGSLYSWDADVCCATVVTSRYMQLFDMDMQAPGLRHQCRLRHFYVF